ncbi:DUF1153 domain-containing protein [Streptomyces sp. NPDC004561]
MFTVSWRRPVLLATASLTLVSGTACAAQAASHNTPTNTPSYSSLAHHTADCGGGGQGGRGGAGGKGGAPGQPGEPGKPGHPGCLSAADLPDKPEQHLTALDKVRIVLIVMSGHATKADVAKKYKIPEKQYDSWQREFRNGDWLALLDGASPFTS